MKGLTLEQAEEETKIRVKYLDALEKENFEILPGKVYAKAFLRTYAKFLDLDSEAIISQYNESATPVQVPEVKKPEPVPPERKRGRSKIKYLGYLVAVIAIGAIFLYNAYGKTGYLQPSKPKPHATKSAPLTTQSNRPAQPKPTQEAASKVNLTLNVTDSTSWIQVVADGNTIFSGELSAGQSKNFQAQQNIYLTLGNAGSVDVQLNGQDLGKLGGPGEVVRKSFTTTQNQS